MPVRRNRRATASRCSRFRPGRRGSELLNSATTRRETVSYSRAGLPLPTSNPPTLMRNRPRMSAGEDLVNFYMTPGYWGWDPSGIVLVSFAIFFAMILADAGYAAVIGLGLLAFWQRLGRSSSGRRFRPLLALIVVVSLVYGVLVGSYFGIAPPKGSFLGRLHWLDMNNSKLMMGLSVLVGGVHVVLANVMDARRYADWRDGLASLGWACAVGGGLLFGAGAAIPSVSLLKSLGGVVVILGLLLVVGFTAWRERLPKRLAIWSARVDADFRRIRRRLELPASVRLGTGIGFACAGVQRHGCRNPQYGASPRPAVGSLGACLRTRVEPPAWHF